MTDDQLHQLITKVQNKSATKEEELELLQAINASLKQFTSLVSELNEAIKQDSTSA
jgi:hypothetical protein